MVLYDIAVKIFRLLFKFYLGATQAILLIIPKIKGCFSSVTKMDNILQVKNLQLTRGALNLCDGLSFGVGGGQMRVLRGANGTGKTTLLQALAGLRKPDAGQILWDGIPITQHDNYPKLLCYIGHRIGLRTDMRVDAHLEFFAHAYGNPELLGAALNYFDLWPLSHLPIGALSAGWMQRVQLARLILSPARLWLLDEPSHHLDAEALGLLQSLISTRLERGGLVIMASHAQIEGIDAGTITLGEQRSALVSQEALC